MNGWWWNPAEPGRGFFVEERDGRICIACCHYAADGAPRWETVGPVELRNRAIESRSATRLPGVPHGEGQPSHAFRFAFTGTEAALLDWEGTRIALEPQHRALRAHAQAAGDLTGFWIEQSDGPRFALACEDLGGRLFAILLAPDGWVLLEPLREGEGRYAGSWWRFEGGQALGKPHRLPQGAIVAEGAEVTCAADGTLVVRMPDGGLTRFARMLAGGKPGRIEVNARAPSASRASSGLVAFTFEIRGGGTIADSAYRFTLESEPVGAVRYERALQLGPWTRRLALLVNTHLLANGKLNLRARLTRAGKPLWSASFALTIRNAGPLAETVRASLQEHGAQVVIEDFVDSSHFDIGNRDLQPWFEQPDAREHIVRLRDAGGISAEEAATLERFVEEGYIVLPAPIEETLLRKIDGELQDAIARKVDGYEFGSSQRIRNLHQRYSGVEALWRHPLVMRYLELIFGVPARPCQTLTYVFGSQQEAHQDTVHLTPFPAGYMCGVWVALEDVQPNSGELQVFPRTHRLPRIYMNGAGCAKVVGDNWKEFGEKVVARYRRMLDEGGFEPVTYRPKRGTVLIWHENLLHGGSVRIDPKLTRRSIVSHYFADGAIAFYDSTGLAGNME